jgi:hypothetical protein
MPTDFEHGPYLTVAALCDRILQEKDGVISLIRVIDKITSSPVGPGTPAEMPPIPVNVSLVIMLRAGDSGGNYTVTIRPEGPTMASPPTETEVPVSFSGAPGEGANLVVNIAMVATTTGLYWFSILLDGYLLTRVPLRIEYSPLRTGVQGLAPE